MIGIQEGHAASIQKIFSPEEVAYYCAHISGDANAVHFEKLAARKLGFEERLVPGIMSSALFGGLLGSTLPGQGTIQLAQSTRFLKPVYIGERVTATIRVTSIRPDKPIATFLCVVKKENGDIAVEGEAVVKFPKTTS